MARIHTPVSLLFLLLILVAAVARADNESSSVDQKCMTEAAKLTDCVGYASGQETAPTGACCGSVTEVKGTDPACLCRVIQHAHSGGSGGLSGFHLRLDRLLSLPKACALANSSVSNCPKLLNLPSSSPDYAIFTNASYANSTSAGSGSASRGTANRNDRWVFFVFAAASAVLLLFFKAEA
ncbi:putative GPI-anchored protein [Apostasia shenzhenica]|uniref:Putative GPI-anchored protein n=1 Tax=Apostasia shenzhenica TaxID=1088818 RepID=A0A2I0B7N2_9ASPA|nr:putative GPI-anchored protein [Apostasia shenzhenica]